ncbi:MAG: APC family permease [Thermoprotei archaeon]
MPHVTNNEHTDTPSGVTQETLVVRRLGFFDAFFLAFGGQSILLSLLTYGAAVITLAGYFSPVAVALGALLVLLNGAVVQRLSNIYPQNGGYYNYANKINRALGTHTGWVYISYATLYGGAYVVGTAFVVGRALGLNPMTIALFITLAAITLVLLGVKPSTRYAMVTGLLEMGVILYIVAISFINTHLKLYDPFSEIHLSGSIPLAILLGASIPTGYGVLAQVSGEVVEAERNVGKAMFSVIIIGGLLASLFVLALSNVAYNTNMGVHTLETAKTFGIISNLNIGARPIIIFSVLSDGVLGAMAYLMAATRTIWRMSQEGHIPKWFGGLSKGEPINTLAILSPIYIFITTLSMFFLPIFEDFVALGVVAALCSMYIHFVAGTSLLSHARKPKLKSKGWAVVALVAMCYTGFNFIFSLYGGKAVYAIVFLGVALTGVLYTALQQRGKDHPR